MNREPQVVPSPPSHAARFGWLAAYIILFGIMLPNLKSRASLPYQKLPPPSVEHVSKDIRTALAGEKICRKKYPEAFVPFGFRSEFAHVSAIRKICRTGTDGEPDLVIREPANSR